MAANAGIEQSLLELSVSIDSASSALTALGAGEGAMRAPLAYNRMCGPYTLETVGDVFSAADHIAEMRRPTRAPDRLREIAGCLSSILHGLADNDAGAFLNFPGAEIVFASLAEELQGVACVTEAEGIDDLTRCKLAREIAVERSALNRLTKVSLNEIALVYETTEDCNEAIEAISKLSAISNNEQIDEHVEVAQEQLSILCPNSTGIDETLVELELLEEAASALGDNFSVLNAPADVVIDEFRVLDGLLADRLESTPCIGLTADSCILALRAPSVPEESLQNFTNSIFSLVNLVNDVVFGQSKDVVPSNYDVDDSGENIIDAMAQMQNLSLTFSLQYLSLQQKIQQETREYTLLSNIMKARHDAAKNAINNIR
jgi:hypothetical protein